MSQKQDETPLDVQEERHRIESEEVELKKQKSTRKAKFTRNLNRLLDSLDDEETPNKDLKAQLDIVEGAMDEAVESIHTLADLYKTTNQTEKMTKTMKEVDVLEANYDEMMVKYRAELFETSSLKSEVEKEDNLKNEPKTATLGQDMWKQLRRVSIPVFAGDKREFDSWKAAFDACVDKAPATPEYKLLQLRQYLKGEALNCIQELGHSAAAYSAAMERLTRKYGGTRRTLTRFMDDLDKFNPIRTENTKDIERFADLLDLAIVKLQELDHKEDLSNGALYIGMLKKLPQSMLVRYNRWIFENKLSENLHQLKTWVLQESEFATTASETINGLSKPSDTSSASRKPYRNAEKSRTYYADRVPMNKSCGMCNKQGHETYECAQFKALDLANRWTKAKEKKLCFRCLRNTHTGNKCWQKKLCNIDGCTKTHSKLLHTTPQSDRRSELRANAPEFQSASGIVEQSFTSRQTNSHIALRTVPVILTTNNRTLKVNALLDDGSSKSYINEDIAYELGLEGQEETVTVNLLNGKTETFRTRSVDICIESENREFKMNIVANTTKNVTGSLKAVDWNEHSDKWEHLQGIAFPSVTKKSKVDLLIGIDYSDLHMSLREIKGESGDPIARLTPLGWTCVGPTSQQNVKDDSFVSFFASDRELDVTLQQFWKTEHIEIDKPVMSCDDRVAYGIAKDTIVQKDNSYEISIPWKENRQVLGNNYDMALSRLKNTEKRLKKDPVIGQAYSETISEYVKKGYITKVPENEQKLSPSWYLPHFPVVRLDKETTKVRIVFDASAKNDGVCLNDVIHAGPKLQNELFDVLLRFRKKPVAVICDIAEMYLRVGINVPDRRFHRFLWNSEAEPPEQYEFNRLVFGVNTSPFLAQFVAQENANRYADLYPMAAETVIKSTYMDDSMDSADSEDEAIELYKQLTELWGKAGMYARKWLSNSAKVLAEIPQDARASKLDLNQGVLPTMKTLGILWSAEEDKFTFKYSLPEHSLTLTKRNFLKKIASLFDPQGFIAPYVIRAKMLMQDLWVSGVDWDEEVNADTAENINRWFAELEDLQMIEVPRCIQLETSDSEVKCVSLHTFVDASEMAYGAVIFSRYEYESGDVSIRIVASKSRVAPLVAISIPRLELEAAVLGVRLTVVTCKALDIDIENATLWSDSMNVLFWIKNRSRMFKSFIANRVGEIQNATNPNQWRKVPTSENPADYISRGLSVKTLASSSTWWAGPDYLHLPETEWPTTPTVQKKDDSIRIEEKPQQTMTYHNRDEDKVGPSDELWSLNPRRFSRWTRLVRVSAWVYRFLHNCRSSDSKTTGPLGADELRDCENRLIKQAQLEDFKSEISALSSNKNISTDSKILNLNPKLDEDGILRADTRMKYAEFIPLDIRNPVILPRKNVITKLIVRQFHEQNNHCGTNHTLTALSTRYWVVHAREEIRDVEKNCYECKRRKVKAATQIMGPIPSYRLGQSMRAFSQTAVDYAGPFVTKQGRGKARQKRYLCVFTCMNCRAIHLEVANSLDTDAFLNAFARFVSRRGLPELVLSDNGTNFVGAVHELNTLFQKLDKDRVIASAANKGIKWLFIPPYGPHFGGVHESMVKSAKRALYRILGNADVNDEELVTAVIGAEGLINSRPITYQSVHPEDECALTPNHFLHGQIGGQFAPETVDTTSFDVRKRWRRIQELLRHFWDRWRQEYLPTLGSRKKWLREARDFQVGDVVLIMDPDVPRGHWVLGRVTKVFPGADGHVRVAEVRNGKKIIKRPITRLALLVENQQ